MKTSPTNTENLPASLLREEARTSPLMLEGVEIPILNRYLLSTFVLIGCLLLLAWSRLHLQETRVSLGHAQVRYEAALKEQHRLELELNLLLSPAAIEEQVAGWGLNNQIEIIEISETDNP